MIARPSRYYRVTAEYVAWSRKLRSETEARPVRAYHCGTRTFYRIAIKSLGSLPSKDLGSLRADSGTSGDSNEGQAEPQHRCRIKRATPETLKVVPARLE